MKKNGGIVVISLVKLSVKFTTVFIVRIRVGRVAFGLVEDVGSLVLLAHAVNDEHDEQNGAEQTHDGSPDHGCKQTLKTFFEIIRLNTDGSKRSSGREHHEQQQPHRHGYYTAAHSHRRQGERHSQMYWRLFSVCVIGHVATAQKGLGLLLHKEKNQKKKNRRRKSLGDRTSKWWQQLARLLERPPLSFLRSPFFFSFSLSMGENENKNSTQQNGVKKKEKQRTRTIVVVVCV